MTVSKIKVVDVVVGDEEVVEKTYNEISLEDNEEALAIEDDEITVEPEPEPEPEPETKTKQRIQQLVECERCGKMLTQKSLKYNHKLHCGVVKEVKVKGADTKPVAVKSAPKPVVVVPPPPTVPTVHKSFEEMRRERMIQRMNDKRESARQLFLQAI
jgi:hypothetical protein